MRLRSPHPTGLRNTLAGVVLGLLTAGCALPEHHVRPDAPRRAALVLHTRDLRSSHSLLQALIDRVPNLRATSNGRCPPLSLRGRPRISALHSATVYIDGIRAMDTCWLAELSPVDIERVEVYHAGRGLPPGYAGRAGGSILVFLRDRG